ncbi:hypothetical protein CHS0354_011850 [Potamilus streckersoni]|uniref:Uncharacterized protein n=1 Tax=Potamilus streckersoni TaxID=2493646 RepID=A0AAE0SE41_9BIVA|nr:hypothetical protein CHS0354_011850 [Potamilus streckersoni]
MARNPFASRNTDHLSPVSLQNAVAHMISNPHAFINYESPTVPSFDQTSWSNTSQAPEPHGRSESQGQQLQGENDTENQPSYRSDSQRHRSYESSIAQREQHLSEGHEQIRNELVEIDIPLVADNDLQADSIENPSNSDVGFPLSTTSNFIGDSLPAGSIVRSPQYDTYKERLTTFKNWPDYLTQRPQELTQAGFYFLGTADVVRCFACDGGLKNWEPEDDPWIEHARWFSSCVYLRHVKGEEFIQLVHLMDEESAEEERLRPAC